MIFLFGNKLDDECMQPLGEFIRANKSIDGIRIGNNSITDKGIEILSTYICDATTITSLGLNGNQDISNKSISLLNKMIENSHIEEIDIRYTGIDDPCVLVLPLAVNKLKNGVDKFDFNTRNLSDSNVDAICKEIMKHGCSKIKEIK